MTFYTLGLLFIHCRRYNILNVEVAGAVNCGGAMAVRFHSIIPFIATHIMWYAKIALPWF